jgi:hypothetical protein
MSIRSNSPFLTVAFVFVFILSGVLATPVYADESLPPVDVPAEIQAEETAPQESGEEEAPPSTTGEVDSAPSESGLTNDAPILEQLPENTEIIITNEEGESIPLATQEAQEILDDGIIDPVWCPVGVAPQNGTGGCTTAYPSLQALFNALMNGTAGVVPNAAGVIWIEQGADSSAAAMTLNGTDVDLGNMENFALTLQGGWDGNFGSKAIVGNSTFGQSVAIINWNAPITINNVVVNATSGVGLSVTTTGSIVLKDVESNNNASTGAVLDNTSGVGDVTITNGKFYNNGGLAGLRVLSNGTITIKNLSADDNSSYGAMLVNDTASTAKAVSVTGNNTFNLNTNVGLFVSSIGAVTLSNISASNNNTGADINNALGSSTAGVTLTGTNVVNDNVNNGINITSYGAIKANNLLANSNNGIGAYLFNSGATVGKPGVTLTGTNEFKYNNFFGLSISTNGPVSVNNVSANTNNQTGVSINSTSGLNSAITFTGTNYFNDNGYSGLVIQSAGQVTISNITANGNGTSMISGYGVSITNSTLTSFKGVTLLGTNTLNNNYSHNLIIISSGAVTLNNITANNSANGFGVSIDNTPSGVSKPMAITINGTNKINTNYLSGLNILSYGAIVLNNITANYNGQGMSGGNGYGASIVNNASTTPQNVTLKGTNTFDDNYDTGLLIITKGAVTTNSVSAFSNNDYGVFIQNSSGTGNVTMTGTNALTSNGLDNLYIISAGTITLSNITANNSTSGMGANISNMGAASPKNVTINGTNSFSNNNSTYGLLVQSQGVITTNNLTAIGNLGSGALLYNAGSSIKAGVTLNGTNVFNSSTTGSGLNIQTSGNIKINSISALNNSNYGLQINGAAHNTGSVTLTGTNVFDNNSSDNVYISVFGAVTVSNIISLNSNGVGLYIDNTLGGNTAPKPVTINGANVFSGNSFRGLEIYSYGAVTTNNLTANSNGIEGVFIDNNGTAAGKAANVTLNGKNNFDSNSNDNLYIISDGLVKLNNVTSTNAASGWTGAYINNTSGTQGVTLTGTNVFSNNGSSGLWIQSKGAITINNLTAQSNGGTHGVVLDNDASGAAAPKAVTLTGANSFSYNWLDGLYISTYGAVTTNNLTATYNGVSGFMGSGVTINNYQGINTIAANITLNGNNVFLGNFQYGLFVQAFGAIKANNITASGNGGVSSAGVFLDTSNAPSASSGNITLTGTNTSTSNAVGFEIDAKGAVSLNNVTASTNSGAGLLVDNTFATTATPKPVTLTGINSFTYNGGNGLNINSYGAVTMSKITASNNSGSGAQIYNDGAATPANVTITGYGTFNSNTPFGLTINSKGAITLANITANGNSNVGMEIINNTGTGAVTFTGVNTFVGNVGHGAHIVSSGNVSVTKITGDNNAQSGLSINTTGAVTITCGSFNVNSWYGWDILNASSATIKGVFTAGNTLGDYNTVVPLTVTRACPLP